MTTQAPPPTEGFVTLDPGSSTVPFPAELLDLARGFLRAGLPKASFLWSAEKDWYSVALERRPDPRGRSARALMTCHEVRLPSGVSAREVDVLTLVALGLTNGEIAARLGTRIRTVSTQVERLLVKLGQTGRGGLAGLAVDWGLVRLPVPGGVSGLQGLRVLEVERHRGSTGRPVDHGQSEAHHLLDRKPFVLGTIVGSLGTSTSHGAEVLRGSTLAVSEVNAAGGVSGRRIRHEVARADIYDLDSVRDAFQRLFEKGVDAITSSFVSAGHAELFEMVGDYGVPYLHTDTYEHSVELVRANPGRYRAIFQTCPSEAEYARGFISFLDDLTSRGLWEPPNRRIQSIVIEPDEFDTYAAELCSRANASGWSVDEVISVRPDQVDWAPVVARVQAGAPAAVVIAHWSAEAVTPLQRQLFRLGLPTLIYYVYGPSTPDFAAALGTHAEGVIWSTVTGRYADDLGRRFHREFTEMFGVEPGWSASSAAYDQVKLLAAAWATVATSDVESVSEYLRTTPQRGVNGVYWFGGPGQSAISYPHGTTDPSLGQAQMVYQIQHGTPQPLAPHPNGDLADFRLPPWFPGGARA